MTIEEAHIQLDLRIDRIDSAAYDDIQPEEIDIYLNEATFRFIKSKFEPRSNSFQVGFEQSIKRIEDIRHLIKEKDIDTEYSDLITLEDIYSDIISFPDDYFLPIKGSAVVLYNEDGVDFTISEDKREITGTLNEDYGSRVSALRPSQQQDVHAIASSPFNGTRIKSPLYIFQGDSLHVLTNNNFIIDKVNLTYIKTPTPVSLSGEKPIDLPAPVHGEVIDIAASMILSDINSLTPAGQQTLSKSE